MQTDIIRIVLNVWMRFSVGSIENCIVMYVMISADFYYFLRQSGVWVLGVVFGVSMAGHLGTDADVWDSPLLKFQFSSY